MAGKIHLFPDFLEEARVLAETLSPPQWEINKIVLLGMGGSALGGDLLDSLMKRYSSLPFLVIRDEEIPGCVDDQTLVLSVSYSGNTAETLASTKAALPKCEKKVIAITSGGKLKELAGKEKFPCLEIPGGLMPRAALPFTFVPLIVLLQKMKALPDQTSSLTEAVRILKDLRKEFGEDSKSGKNPAKALASKLKAKLPILYAAAPRFLPAAKRWKCQLNENGKHPAYYDFFPEASHNEIVGFTDPLAVHRLFSVVFLRDEEESAQTTVRVEFAEKRMKACGCEVRSIVSRGKSLLAKLLFLCYYGDFVSLYLAEEKKIDPAPVHVIDELKKELTAAVHAGS